MANIKSQIKRNKQNEKRRERNKDARTSLKTTTKKVHTSAIDGDGETARQHAREASRALDKAASKGIVHKRTAARRKSRLAKTANAAGAEPGARSPVHRLQVPVPEACRRLPSCPKEHAFAPVVGPPWGSSRSPRSCSSW